MENRINSYKMAATNLNSNSRHKISHQKLENRFPEGIFPYNLGLYYNYNAEIKIEKKKVIRFRFYGENKFWKMREKY